VNDAIADKKKSRPAITSKQTHATENAVDEKKVGVDIYNHYSYALGEQLPQVWVACQLYGID
jgi:hypothetical protein